MFAGGGGGAIRMAHLDYSKEKVKKELKEYLNAMFSNVFNPGSMELPGRPSAGGQNRRKSIKQQQEQGFNQDDFQPLIRP